MNIWRVVYFFNSEMISILVFNYSFWQKIFFTYFYFKFNEFEQVFHLFAHNDLVNFVLQLIGFHARLFDLCNFYYLTLPGVYYVFFFTFI